VSYVTAVSSEVFLRSLAAPDSGRSIMAEQAGPPSQDFVHALENPQFISDGKTERAVYTFNQDRVDAPRPLLFFRPISYGVTGRSDIIWWNDFVPRMQRPVITIDMPGTGRSEAPTLTDSWRSSIDSAATRSVRVLDELGVNEVDLAGISLGGTIAVQTAVRLGERARSLTTFGAIGFETDLMNKFAAMGGSMTVRAASRLDAANSLLTDYGIVGPRTRLLPRAALCGAYIMGRNVLQALKHEDIAKDRALLAPDVPPPGSLPEELPAIRVSDKRLLIIGRLCCSAAEGPMRHMPAVLHQDTIWHDYLGSIDNLTTVGDHREAIESRDRINPGSSSLTVVMGAGHGFWLRPHQRVLARVIERQQLGVVVE
jgi:pimeloyl-ACP methyl ester carboxylesterase